MGTHEWRDLPQAVRDAVEHHSGLVSDVEHPSAGRCAEFTATLHTSTGRVFVKGSQIDSPNAWMHRNEARVNRFLPPLAPRLLWQVECDGWVVHGFEHVAGRHADLTPRSPDLGPIGATVATLNEALSQCYAEVGDLAEQWARLSAWRRLHQDTPDDLDPWTRAHLGQFVADEQCAFDVVGGSSLVHTDLRDANIIIGADVHVIDWAWARRGAAWVDTGFLVLRLIAAGHTPADAEQWAMSIPAWQDASDEARTAFATEVLGMWEYLQRQNPLPHRAGLTNVARTWARHRIGVDVNAVTASGCATVAPMRPR